MDTNTEVQFWVNNPKVLLKNYINFFPSSKMSVIENLNAIVRFGVYVSIILSMYQRNPRYLFISIIPLIITYTLYNILDLEKFEETKYDIDMTELKDKDFILPTLNNPMMNVLLNEYADDPNRNPAYPVNDLSKEGYYVKKDMENKLNFNLFRDVSDIYNKEHGQGRFYTMPSTTIPNDFQKYKDYMMDGGRKSCKEDRFNCMKYNDLRKQKHYISEFEKNTVNLR